MSISTASIRRAARDLPVRSRPPIEDRIWPVYLALLGLGGLLMWLATIYQPLDGEVWYRTAWPSLIGVPIVVIAGMIAFTMIDSRRVRRSLEFSLIVGVMLHVGLLVQLFETHVFAHLPAPAPRTQKATDRRPRKLVPAYHSSQLVPEEERPRQDFEKPVETKTPETVTEPMPVVRQRSEEDRSPAEPQPIPVPEQMPTIEPNVVERRGMNEAAPRLSPADSLLSRQQVELPQPRSESVESPAVPDVAARAEARPQEPTLERVAEPSLAAISESRMEAPPPAINQPINLPQRNVAESAEQPAVTPAPERQTSRQAATSLPTQPTAADQIAAPATAVNEPTAAPQPAAASVARAKTDKSAPVASPRRVAPFPATAASSLPAGEPRNTRQQSASVNRAPAPVELAGTAPVERRSAPAPVATSSSTTVASIPEVGPRSAVAQAEIDHGLVRQAAQLSRTSPSPAASVDIRAAPGPGGLGLQPTPDVGILSRQATDDSVNIQLRPARFRRTQVGGLPAVSTAAVIATDAFSSRGARVRGNEPGSGRGISSPQTEEAIERGLAFLARYQRPDGGWSLQGFSEGATLVSDTAATALAVLAFQGAGYNHRQFQYQEVVRGGLNYLLAGQKANGDLFVPLDDASNRSVWLYSHSIAAIAICEAYGMTQEPALREPAQKAIDFILAGQHRDLGGWRYSPGTGSDTSVTGWMMMAMKSGELAGLDLPSSAYSKIEQWLDAAHESSASPHLYRYNPFAPDIPEQRHGRTPSKTMTAVGLLMRLYTGWRRDDPNMARGAAYLVQNPPAAGTSGSPQRDTYYWYYATQVMAHIGGRGWDQWNGRLHPLLVNSQVQQGPYAGSWDPLLPLPDRWGPQAGRLYVTTMNLLSLEVQYRKLPLYEGVIR